MHLEIQVTFPMLAYIQLAYGWLVYSVGSPLSACLACLTLKTIILDHL